MPEHDGPQWPSADEDSASEGSAQDAGSAEEDPGDALPRPSGQRERPQEPDQPERSAEPERAQTADEGRETTEFPVQSPWGPAESEGAETAEGRERAESRGQRPREAERAQTAPWGRETTDFPVQSPWGPAESEGVEVPEGRETTEFPAQHPREAAEAEGEETAGAGRETTGFPVQSPWGPAESEGAEIPEGRETTEFPAQHPREAAEPEGEETAGAGRETTGFPVQSPWGPAESEGAETGGGREAAESGPLDAAEPEGEETAGRETTAFPVQHPRETTEPEPVRRVWPAGSDETAIIPVVRMPESAGQPGQPGKAGRTDKPGEPDRADEPEAGADGHAEGPGEEPGDGGRTAQHPLPKVAPLDQQTLFTPKVTPPEQRTLFTPKVAPPEQRTLFTPKVTPPPPRRAGTEQVTRPAAGPPRLPRRPPALRDLPAPPDHRPPPAPSPPPAPATSGLPTRAEPARDFGAAESTGVMEPVRIPPAEEAAPRDERAATAAQPEAAPPAKPAPPPGEPEAALVSGGRRRGLVLTAVAVLLVVALGVVLALPSVANRLALPWAPNAPKGDPPQPVAVTRSLQGPDPGAHTPTPSGVAAALSGPAASPALGTLTGSVLDPATGTVLWNRDSNQPLTPASTTKLFTVGAALLALDHGLQLSTKVVAGAQPGTVILVAGGDPTLSSLPEDKESFYPGAAHLDDLVAKVKKATGGAVTSVQLDTSAYTGDPTAPGWAPNDAPSTFAAPVAPAMLDGGRTNPNDDHSLRVGNPSAVLLQEFAKRLGAQVAPTAIASAPAGAQVLGEVKSAPLPELVTQLLQHSDNLLADAVGRQTAKARGLSPSFAGAAKATTDVLRENGFDIGGVQLSDNSGLSTQNKIPAKALSGLLAVAAAPDGKDQRTAKLRPMLSGLPVAGGSGTLAGRYQQPPATSGKGWVRAKTGTLDGVNTLAGVVLDTEGRVLVFALMSSGSSADAGRAALDAVAATLRGCGCG